MYVEHDTNDDASRKWRKCIISVKESNGFNKPFMIGSIGVKKSARGNYYLMEGWEIENGAWTPATMKSSVKGVNTNFPDLGFINYKGFPVYMARNSDRIYKKGYGSSTVLCRHVCNEERMSLGMGKVIDTSDPSLVIGVFNTTYRSINDVLQGIHSKEFYGAVVSKTVAIAATTKSLCPAVFYKNSIVGFITDEKNKTIIISKVDISLKEELQEIGFKVEVGNERTNKAV